MVEVQQAIINCFFLNSDTLEYIDDVKEEYFEGHYIEMFRAIKKLSIEGAPVNIETLSESLKDSKLCKEKHILEIFERDSHQLSHTGYFDYYLKKLKENYARVQLALKMEIFRADIIAGAISLDDTRQELIEEFKKYEEIKEQSINIQDIDIMTAIDSENYYKTGLWEIDNVLTGLYNSDLIILAGRTSTGKSAFALWLGEQQLAKKGKVFYVSLEMPARQLAYRVYSNLTGIPYQKIRAGNLKGYECEQIKEAKDKANNNLVIADRMFDAKAVNSAIRKYFKDKKGVAIIDYLQLFGSSSNRNLEIGGICRNLKSTAMEFDIPIILLSQFSRSVEMRPDKEPTLSDLRDSGEIEQHADTVLFTHYKNNDERYKKTSELKMIIPKNRNGKIGYCNIMFDKSINNFYSNYPEPARESHTNK